MFALVSFHLKFSQLGNGGVILKQIKCEQMVNDTIYINLDSLIFNNE